MRVVSFIVIRTRGRAADVSLQHMTWPEYQDPSRQNGNFLTRLWITTDPAPFLSDRKCPEPTDFNRFTLFKVNRDAIQNIFQQIGGLIP
jgi:hypothetical protein